ncbi:MAG: hypothetical protein KDJ37_14020 [Hyphomicrobiaceae bacterium]|nr:hypothetical protein [Hyphomicrobiaceae bacterium]
MHSEEIEAALARLDRAMSALVETRDRLGRDIENALRETVANLDSFKAIAENSGR